MSDIDINQVLSQLRAMASAAQSQAANSPTAAEGGDFSSLLKTAIDKVNDTQMQAGQLAGSFEKGDADVDLTEVMIALQKAKISFQAMVEVRNKLVTAYQDVMNMSI